jgi:hypothetical protein
VVQYGQDAMGRVLNWVQWAVITAGVLLSPVFVVFMVWFIGWSMCGTMRSSTSKLDIGRIESGDGIAAGLSMPRGERLLALLLFEHALFDRDRLSLNSPGKGPDPLAAGGSRG